MAQVRYRVLAIVGAGLLCGVLAPQSHASVYTFESLNTGTLPGQDNWVVGNGGSIQVVVPSGAGNASTRAYSGSGGSGNEDLASRLNDVNFSIPAIVGNDVIIQADFQVKTSGAGQATYGIGRDVNNDGAVMAGSFSGQYEVGPVIGSYYISNPHLFVAINGAGTFAGDVAYPAGYSAGDWIRMQLVMDLAGFSGNGSGSVFIQNLTTGEVGFTAVAGLQNLPLGLNSGGQSPSAWNGMYVETYGGSSNASVGDNLTVIVPEPASAALLACGALVLARRRRV